MGFWDVITAPFKLVPNIGKGAYNGVIKPVANFGAGLVNKVVDTGKDVVTTIVHTPEKVIDGATKSIDKIGSTIDNVMKSPVLIIGGLAALMFMLKSG